MELILLLGLIAVCLLGFMAAGFLLGFWLGMKLMAERMVSLYEEKSHYYYSPFGGITVKAKDGPLEATFHVPQLGSFPNRFRE